MDNTVEKKKINTNVLIKSSFWYTLSTFLPRAMAFITTPIFTRVLSKEQIGDFSVYTSWQALLLGACGLQLYATINRARFDYQNESDFNSYISSCLSLSTLITAFLFVLYLLFPDIFHRVLLLDRKYMMILFLYLFAEPAFMMFQSKQRVEYRYRLSAAVALSITFVSSGLAVALAMTSSGDRLFGRIIGQYSPSIIVGAVFYVFFLKKSRTIRLSNYKYALLLGLPLAFSYLGSHILLSSDNIIVKHMCLGEQVGYLSLSHTCTRIVLLLVSALTTAWSPWFYDKLNANQHQATRRPFMAFIWLLLLGTFGVILFAPEIVAILGGKQYAESLQIVPANILNGVFTALVLQFTNYEVFNKKAGYAGKITGGVAVFNIALDIIGIKLFGYQATCYATVISQIIAILLHYHVMKGMRISEILPFKDLLAVLVVSLLMIPLGLIIYSSTVLRWSVIGVSFVAMIGIVWWKRKEIESLVGIFIKRKRIKKD
ncbi:MAG: oligosaccharide flippase family protein [Clostridia bacterium]|nr:oligosaccharide flippase family protein [Clostridia bacterium]